MANKDTHIMLDEGVLEWFRAWGKEYSVNLSKTVEFFIREALQKEAYGDDLIEDVINYSRYKSHYLGSI